MSCSKSDYAFYTQGVVCEIQQHCVHIWSAKLTLESRSLAGKTRFKSRCRVLKAQRCVIPRR